MSLMGDVCLIHSIYCSITLPDSTFMFEPLVTNQLVIQSTRGALSVALCYFPLNSTFASALNCRFMVPSIVSDCYGSSHVLYVIISLLALLIFIILLFRLAGVENDISCINKQELDSRLKGERQRYGILIIMHIVYSIGDFGAR